MLHEGQKSGVDAMAMHSQNDTERWPFLDPRVAGVREHYQRVSFFHTLAAKDPDPAGKFRLLLAGVYSARAVVELILEAADKGQLRSTRAELRVRLSAQIPWYDLIERIRVHDFHRFGLVPPDPRLRVMTLGGPVNLRLRGQKGAGAAVYSLPGSGPQKLTTGDADIHEQRPLQSMDGWFFDDATRQYVPLDQILRDFVSGAVEAIREFERNLGPTSRPESPAP